MQTKLISLLTVVILGAGFSAAESAYALQPPLHGELRYISGGVGVGERDELQALAPQYNLQLMFSQGREYLSSVQVAIQDPQGRTLARVPSEGPWFLADLPPGDYRIVASAGGSSQAKTVRVGQGPTKVDFIWPPALTERSVREADFARFDTESRRAAEERELLRPDRGSSERYYYEERTPHSRTHSEHFERW